MRPFRKRDAWRGLAALLAVALLFNLTPSQNRPRTRYLPLSDYFSAGAERVCFAGDCPCFDLPYRNQCYAERRTTFQRANPPRGQLEGVCWAQQVKSERDPATNKTVQRYRSPIYSRVRFNETQVLSTWASDDRDAGFEVDVGAAWKDFVQANYAGEFPESDGWSWGRSCVSLNKPRNTEDRYWTETQAQTSYQRVFMPTYGIANTPEERALEAKAEAERKAREAERQRLAEQQKRDADARAAEQARQRAAADAARKAEAARVEAARRAEAARVESERQRKVDAIAQQLGPAKRAEAERLQRMNDELAALRPKPQPKRQCTTRSATQSVSNSADTEAAARSGIARAQGSIGGSETRTSNSVGPASCSQRNMLELKPPPVGKCLACIDEKLAINLYGYVPGKGYPPPRTEWVCTATVTYTAEKCGSGASKVSAQ